MTTMEITSHMIARAADALRGQVAELGCTCRWDEDGNPPADCGCAERATDARWKLAEHVLQAAVNAS